MEEKIFLEEEDRDHRLAILSIIQGDSDDELLRSLLDDYHANTNAGYHCANMAGTWMSMLFGFGGMRINGDELEFAPVLPEKWNSYKFRILFKGRLIEVFVDKNGAKYSVIKGEPIAIKSFGEDIVIFP